MNKEFENQSVSAEHMWDNRDFRIDDGGYSFTIFERHGLVVESNFSNVNFVHIHNGESRLAVPVESLKRNDVTIFNPATENLTVSDKEYVHTN